MGEGWLSSRFGVPLGPISEEFLVELHARVAVSNERSQ